MGFRCGIVGLPNVGKSTLFNALTQTAAAAAANYPFCTIEPNVGNVPVPDPRLTELARIAHSAKIIETQLGFTDIAGLVRGASKGEGLGNQFLGNIRETDAIVHVLRCFVDDDVTHVEGRIDPVADAETVETELMLSDLESLEKRVPAFVKKAGQGDKEAKVAASVLGQALDLLREGKPARLTVPKDDDEARVLGTAQLLTAKPVALRLQRRRGERRDRQRPVGGGGENGGGVRRGVGRHLGGDRVRDRPDGPCRPARLPRGARPDRDRPRPRRPRRLRPAQPADLLHGGSEGGAGVDDPRRDQGPAGRRRHSRRLRTRLHPRRDDRLRRLRPARRRGGGGAMRGSYGARARNMWWPTGMC